MRAPATFLALLMVMAAAAPLVVGGSPATFPTLRVHVPADGSRAFFLHVPAEALTNGCADIESRVVGGDAGALKSIQLLTYGNHEARPLTGIVEPGGAGFATPYYDLCLGGAFDLLVIASTDGAAPIDLLFTFADADDGTVQDAPIAYEGVAPRLVLHGEFGASQGVDERDAPLTPEVAPPPTLAAPTRGQERHLSFGYAASAPTPYFLESDGFDGGAGVQEWTIAVDGAQTKDVWAYQGNYQENPDGNGGSGSSMGGEVQRAGLLLSSLAWRYDSAGLTQDSGGPGVMAAFTPLDLGPDAPTFLASSGGFSVQASCTTSDALQTVCTST